MSVEINRGIITEIHLKNFITYDNVVIKPGRNLNLIIGPNGTGKSTIVSGIILGLGGQPKVIGRGDSISTFVKDGQTKATIIIHLSMEKQYITVERTFDKENKSTWRVNDKPLVHKKVLDLMKGLNIQVDNLCQFLPQDRVQEFSKLANRDLLYETERSLNEPLLLENHTKLKELRSKQAELEKDLATHTMLHDKHKQDYDGMKDNVGLIQEQKQIKRKLKELKQKRAWVQYQLKKDSFDEAKKGKEHAEKKVKKLKKKLEPITEELGKIKASISSLEKTAKQYNSETSAKNSKLSKFLDEIEKCEKVIDDFETQCGQRVREEQECDMHINQLKQQINKMENDLKAIIESVVSESQLETEIKNLSNKMDTFKSQISNSQLKQQSVKDDVDRLNRKVRDISTQLEQIGNVEDKRLNMLQQLSNDAYRGVVWLRNNKHLFSAPVYEPIMLHINIKDPRHAPYFENTIGFRDLTAFVCEDKRDMNMLINKLRGELKLKVNAVHSDPAKIVNYNPHIPLDHIRQYGFEHYLISLLDAPDTILKYLVTHYALNVIPIGNDKVASNIDRLPDQLRRFFSTNNVYSVNKSKYTNEKSISQSAIFSRGHLAISVDQEKINYLQREGHNLNEQKNTLNETLNQYKNETANLLAQLEEVKKHRLKLQSKQENIQKLRFKINVNNGKISKAESNRKSVDEIRSQYKAEIETVISNQLKLYEKYDKMVEECFKNIIINEELKLQVKLKKNQLAQKENDSQELREELSNAERNLKTLESELLPLKLELKEYYNEALKATDGKQFGEKEFEPYKKIFSKLPKTDKELFDEIQATSAKIFSLSEDPEEAERTLDRFKKVKRALETLNQQITEKEKVLQNITEEINTVKNEWLPLLLKVVDKINTNFGDYFKKMNCAGEVSLSKPDNEYEFDKYGLKIRVKFRDADELQELTRNHQSGGERAVTTAVYMIALQELTKVPFRCVDEINQGMDATNERRVFELIVDITSKSNSSQYFLLTPKLLPDLKYNDSITVLTVYNSKSMLSSSEFDLPSSYDKIVEVVSRRQNCAMEE